MKNRLIQFVLFMVILLVPFIVNAEVYETESSKDNGYIRDFNYGSLYFRTFRNTKYSNYDGKGDTLYFDAAIENGYKRHIELNMTLNLYNKNGGKLDSIKKEFTIDSGKIELFVAEVHNNAYYNLKEVSYYNYTIDVITNVSSIDNSESFFVSNYNIKLDVGENNIYKVEENFEAVFKNSIVPVNFGIPLRLKYVRPDGSSQNKRIVLKNIDAHNKLSLKTEKGIRLLSIGDKDKNGTSRDINLTYEYNVGKDTLRKNDEVVFYLVSNINTKLDNLSFEIKLPVNVDYEDVKFIDGNGIVIEDVKYQVDDNIVIGKIDRSIDANSNYAVYILLPDKTFKNTISTTSKLSLLCIIVPIVFVIITILVWFLLKKYAGKSEFKKFYFNKNINSLELGYLYTGKVKDSDIATLLFCLASKGYIKIKMNKKDYTIIKLKEYESNDRVEKVFMKELFYDNNEVSRSDLSLTAVDIKESINNKLNERNRKKKIFVNPIINFKIIFWIMILVILGLNIGNILLEYQPSVWKLNFVLSGIGYIVLFNGLLNHNRTIEKVLAILVSIILIISPIILTSYDAFIQDKLYLFYYIVGLLCMVIICVMKNIMNDRTAYGNKMFKKISGYKDFLINCSEEDIDKELDNNPDLFFDVLPYSLVLGISDKFILKFDDYELEGVDWYENDKFDVNVFYEDIKNIYSDMFILLKQSKLKK